MSEKTRREIMRDKYLALAEKADRDGDKDTADKMRLAAKRCAP